MRFENIRGNRVMWRDCSFDQVTATGTVEVVHFIDCDFQATDLSGLHLVEGAVMNTRRADVTVPSLDDAFAVSAEAFARVFSAELPTMTERSRHGVANLEPSDGLDTLLAGSGNGETFWSAALIADMFDIEPADADRIVERLMPYRLTRLIG